MLNLFTESVCGNDAPQPKSPARAATRSRMARATMLSALLTGIICMGLFALPVQAENANSVQELLRLIEAQRTQLEAQQKLLEAQQKQLDSQTQSMQKLEKKVQSLVEDQDATRDIATVTLPTEAVMQPAKPSPSRKFGLSNLDRYDSASPSGSNTQVGDHRQTLKTPDSKIKLGIHGFTEFQMIHDSDGMDNNEFDTAKIDVDGAPSQTKFNVNPTRLEVSAAMPVPEGQVNAFISMDFNGELDQPEPRLRMAYGEWVNENLGVAVLAGQAYNTMLDLQAIPETLDFAGPAALFERRQPMLRVTKAFADSFMAAVALETPENTSYTNASRRSRWPDLVLAGDWYADGKYLKHLRLAGLARDLRADGDDDGDNGGKTNSTFGWAIYGSTKLGVPLLDTRDNLKINIHYGDGYGAQLKGGPDDGVYNTNSGNLRKINVFGSYGGFQHWWSSTLRSNLVYGYVNADNPGFAAGDTLDNTTYTAANLIWNPYKKMTLGLEYLWGQRENKDGESGTDNRFLFSSKVAF